MHLAAVVNVVQEEVRKQIADALRDDAGVAAIRRDAPVEIRVREAVAEGYELLVEFACALARLSASGNSENWSPTARPRPPSTSMSK